MTLIDQHCFDFALRICFVPAAPGGTSIFGFAEYVTVLALLLVIYSASDFSYKYRLELTRYNIRTLALLGSFAIGFLILLIDAWFLNKLWVPQSLNNANNIKLFLALAFLSIVFYMNYIVFIGPPVFGRTNARFYFEAMHFYIGRGNPDQLLVVADTFTHSTDSVMRLAAEGAADLPKDTKPDYPQYARWCLLLLGSRSLCRVMVDKSPWTIAAIFQNASEHLGCKLPLSQFARNIGSELLINPNSPLYNEDSGFFSGFLGYTKPITKSVYGNFSLVEELAQHGGCSLDIDLGTKHSLTGDQLEAYSRGALIFCEAYLESPHVVHSYAFIRTLNIFSSATASVGDLNGRDKNFYTTEEYKKLVVTVDFVRELATLLQKKPLPQSFRADDEWDGINAIYDQVAKLMFEVIFAASYISSPYWTCWSVQHNAVWSKFFSVFEREDVWRILGIKVRRLLYDEVVRMDEFPNFKSARILGFLLNVLGLSEDRKAGVYKRSRGLKRLVLYWTKRNYLALTDSDPKVAEVCLQGSISFDAPNRRLVKTYSGELGREPGRSFLALDLPR